MGYIPLNKQLALSQAHSAARSTVQGALLRRSPQCRSQQRCADSSAPSHGTAFTELFVHSPYPQQGQLFSALSRHSAPILRVGSSVAHEAGFDPRGLSWVTWDVYLCAGEPPLADIILSHPPGLTRCDSVIGLAIPAISGHIQYRGAASLDLYIRISGINRVFLS